MHQIFVNAPLLALILVGHTVGASAQTSGPAVSSHASSRLTLETGRQIWEAGCVSCHGPDGRGQAKNLAGFEPPGTFPDFPDCPTSTVESDTQWRAVITHGGPARGFSPIMPAFRDMLTPRQVDLVIDYMRGLCTEPAWPRGNLNLPRPMVTEKAFPESETVVTGSFNAQRNAGVSSTAVYEHRFGATAMWEVMVPYEFVKAADAWSAAFGDLALGYKQTLFHSLETGTIFSAGGELIVPTGSVGIGTGGRSTVFEGYAALGQLFRGASFVQLHSGVELPAHPDRLARAFYFRSAAGKTFATNAGLGRRWTPMVEFVGDRELENGAAMKWDIIPQLQIPMNRRMHVLGSLAFRFPVNDTGDRPRQLMFYVLWDWMDGGLTAGW